MWRLVMAGTVLAGLCGPAVAFDFTPRTFGPLYDARIRVGPHVPGLCGSAVRDVTCSYGIEGKDPAASISNMEAKGDRANSASLSWPVALPLASHVEQLRAFVALCSPRAGDARRDTLVGRLLDQGRHPSQGPTRGYMLDGVRYAATAEADGSITVEADDLRMPAPADVADGWGATDEIK